MLDKYYNSYIATFETYFVNVYDLLENYYYNRDLDRDLDYCDNAYLYLNDYNFDCDFFYDAIVNEILIDILILNIKELLIISVILH